MTPDDPSTPTHPSACPLRMGEPPHLLCSIRHGTEGGRGGCFPSRLISVQEASSRGIWLCPRGLGPGLPGASLLTETPVFCTPLGSQGRG